MSANPKGDLQQVKTLFENFRARRVRKERLPESLWGQAIALLEHYPLRVVCRELRLKPNYLRQRAEAVRKGSTEKFRFHSSPKKPRSRAKQDFLSLTASELSSVPTPTQLLQTNRSTTECRVVIERTDGGRLTLTVPMDWSRIEAMCAGFLRA